MWGWSSATPVVFVAKAKAAAKQLAQPRSTPSARVVPAASSRPRSRSPRRAALPALRSDAPGRLDHQLAALPSVFSPAEKRQALEDLDRDILAASTNRIHGARLRTIGNALLLWGIPMWPPTPASWKALAATLKVGRYAAAAVYFSTYRTAAERLGYVMDEFAIRSVKDYTRSCLRGLGAPARPRALPFESLIELPRSRDPWASNGPVNPRVAIVTRAW